MMIFIVAMSLMAGFLIGMSLYGLFFKSWGPPPTVITVFFMMSGMFILILAITIAMTVEIY